MTPFQQFRLWARRAPNAERVPTLLVALALIGLACWALVPVDHNATNVVAPPAPAATTPASTGNLTHTPSNAATTSTVAPGSTSSGVLPTTPASTGTASTGPASTGPTSTGSGPTATPSTTLTVPPALGCGPASPDQGVTATAIHIDVDVPNLAGQAGNALVGLPSPSVEQNMFKAAIAAANLAGGARCRTLVAKFYTVNPLDQPSEESVCLQMVADHPFALLDDGLGSPAGAPTPRDCPPANKVPEFGVLALSQGELHQFAPYLFGDGSSAEEVINDWIFGAHQLGWFNGARKIGILEQDCVPDLNHLTMSDLAAIGIPSSEITTFDFGCPNAIPSPTEVESAVLQFQEAKVTNVMDDGGDLANYFSKDAANQSYVPRYSVGDQGTIALWDNPEFGPNPKNFANALAITNTQYGANNNKGMTFNTQTAACNKAMAAANLPTTQASPDGLGGVACTLVNMFVIAADHAPVLQRNELAAGLRDAGQASFPFPIGPANFIASGGQHGGGFWRPDLWSATCGCFYVERASYSPSFSATT